jgi:hypothetical protein
MQDESHTDSTLRPYAGGKWKRQTASAAEDAKTALDAASVTVKERAQNSRRSRSKLERTKSAGSPARYKELRAKPNRTCLRPPASFTMRRRSSKEPPLRFVSEAWTISCGV